MVGNDIVDINEAKSASNWQRPRFLEKLFTTKEQFTIRNAETPFLMVWQLWSMKEAAYKLYTQQHPSRFYNPKGFECSTEGAISMVRFKTFTCYVATQITPYYIISEARLDVQPITSKVIKFKNTTAKAQSKTIRNTVLKAAANVFGVSKTHLKISTSKHGVPSIHVKSKVQPLSLTHHGNYGAYAFC
ncbi:4'-phosphopantetheinyl transferase family protein [Jejuia pallidilutea]|uniref:4'-phosphopantetheinyl transferase domain-containing protein n=1 Tax=Jejuia pallidilutea TaxID=504487 RepID=A0A090VQA8_9FLAO|nr:4'-phosphopantetheinyl transferase superfamily protein [Jejuia pallidilutea]GAL65479.1 hypothetical protein JCM19301_3939 [Jejuia pallidilutea]GAL70036.1 hypothetical protein JCM19302_2611 [Jejuia pallidilutea]GAL88970.1 hypothetical protein JCM19538_1959 [Jejuia pallidilutea]